MPCVASSGASEVRRARGSIRLWCDPVRCVFYWPVGENVRLHPEYSN